MTQEELSAIPWKNWPPLEKNKSRGWCWVDGWICPVDAEGNPAPRRVVSLEKWRQKPPPGESNRTSGRNPDADVPMNKNGIPVLDRGRVAQHKQERRAGRRRQGGRGTAAGTR